MQQLSIISKITLSSAETMQFEQRDANIIEKDVSTEQLVL